MLNNFVTILLHLLELLTISLAAIRAFKISHLKISHSKCADERKYPSMENEISSFERMLHQLLLLTFKCLFVNYSGALHVATHSSKMHLHRNFASARHTIESASQSPARAFVMRARNLQVIQEFHLSAGQVPHVYQLRRWNERYAKFN